MEKDFYTSLNIGSKSEEVVEVLLTKQNKDWRRTPHTEYARLNLDFESDYYIKNEDYFIEVKSLAGHYETACIEKYKNKENPFWNNVKGRYMNIDNQKDVKYPGWMRTILAGQALQVYILNRAHSTIYIFDGKKLYNYVQAYPDGGLTAALDGNKDDSGWLVKFGWMDEKAGFIKKISFKKGAR